MLVKIEKTRWGLRVHCDTNFCWQLESLFDFVPRTHPRLRSVWFWSKLLLSNIDLTAAKSLLHHINLTLFYIKILQIFMGSYLISYFVILIFNNLITPYAADCVLLEILSFILILLLDDCHWYKPIS